MTNETNTNEQDKYKKAWESHLNDFYRLAFSLPQEKIKDFEDWILNGKSLIDLATKQIKHEVKK